MRRGSYFYRFLKNTIFSNFRYVWRYYLEMKEFGKARKITSQMRDRAPYQMVIKKEAEKFIADKKCVKSLFAYDYRDDIILKFFVFY